jgi:hypothetical protein
MLLPELFYKALTCIIVFLSVYNKPELAQHCFIKSIQVEHNVSFSLTCLLNVDVWQC